jgi:anti-sigma regulatory factor (Ser/Thr protein kinase)
VETHIEVDAYARAHETFELAVGELIENAIFHVHGEPSVSVTVRDRPESDVVEVRVADAGPGIPEMGREVLLRGSETPLAHT